MDFRMKTFLAIALSCLLAVAAAAAAVSRMPPNTAAWGCGEVLPGNPC
jgi:hypothetical protein